MREKLLGNEKKKGRGKGEDNNEKRKIKKNEENRKVFYGRGCQGSQLTVHRQDLVILIYGPRRSDRGSLLFAFLFRIQ